MADRRWFRRLIPGAAEATAVYNQLNKDLAAKAHGKAGLRGRISAEVLSNPRSLLG
jgi:hypothetical protein